jgi:hypothetical protein
MSVELSEEEEGEGYGSGPRVAVPNGRVDKLIARRWQSVPPAFRSDFDAAWVRVNYHVELTHGSESHKQCLKWALYMTMLVPIARGRRGLMGAFALVFDDWLTTFARRRVSKWEIAREVAVGVLLIGLVRIKGTVKVEKAFEIPDLISEGDDT